MSTTELLTDERAVRGTSSPVMGMVLFVAGEAMFFAAFFGVYFSIRTSFAVWPPKSIGVPELPIPTTLTAILIASSVVLQVGVRAVRRGRVATFRSLLALQAYDYSRLTFGVGDGIYPSLFYIMTGLHMAHVAGGVVLLSIVLGQATTGQISTERHEPVEAATIYWHFVDLVWIGLFISFYLSVR